MATNANQNKNYPTEPKRINHALTDSGGGAFLFADLLTHDVVVFDEMGNSYTPTDVAQGGTDNVLSYTVNTDNFRAGNITARLNLTFYSVNFVNPLFARDIIEVVLFKMEDITK
jgi:hypothetical protein